MPTRPRPSRLILALAAAASLAALHACASDHGTQRPKAAAVSPDSTESAPRLALQHAIHRESRHPSKLARQAPPPPGLEDDNLQPITDDQPDADRARLPLDRALAEVEQDFPQPAPFDNLNINPADRHRALALYAEGRALRLDHHDTRAIEALEEAARLDPDAAAPWREIGEAQLELGDRHAARIAFARAFDRNPDDPRVLEQVAALAADDFSDSQTAAILARLLRTRTSASDPALEFLIPARLGTALLNLGYLDAAVQLLRRAVDLPERFASPSTRGPELASLYRRRGDLWTTIGDAHLRLAQPAQALDAYEHANEFPSLDPHGLLQRRVYAAMRLGRPAEAAALILDQMAGNGARAEDDLLDTLHYVTANSNDAQDIDTAILALQDSLIEPERRLAGAHIVRARAAVLPPDRAVQIFRDHIASHPTDAVALSGLFDLLADNSPQPALAEAINLTGQAPLQDQRFIVALLRAIPDPPALLAAWNDLDEKTRQRPEARLIQARLLAAANEPAEADRAFQALLTDHPGFAPAVIARVQLLDVLERREEADALLQSIDTTDDPNLAFAKALALTNRPETQPDALALVERTLSTIPPNHPRHVDLLLLAASLAKADQDDARAEQCYRDALQLDPAREDAHAGLIQLYASDAPLANDQKLVDQLARLREVNPSSRILRTIRAREALSRGQYDLAERSLLDLTEQFPDDANAIDALVNLWSRMGAHDRAQAWLDRQIDRFPARNIYQIKLAEVLVHQGRFRDAANKLEAWLSQYPGDVAVSRLLERIYAEGLHDQPSADRLALRRLERAGAPERTARQRAVILLRLTRLDNLLPAVKLAVKQPDNENHDLARWGNLICGDLYRKVLQGTCPPSLALEAISLICDNVDELVYECHEFRIKLIGSLPDADLASAHAALDRLADEYPDRLRDAYATIIQFLNSLQIRADFDLKGRLDTPHKPRPATTPELIDRVNVAARLALEGAALPGNTPNQDNAFLALQFQSLVSAYRGQALDKLDNADQFARNIRNAPDKRELIHHIYNLPTTRAERVPTDQDALQIAIYISNLFIAMGDVPAADTFDDLALEYDPDNPTLLNNYAYRLLERNDPALLDRATQMLLKAYNATPDPPSHIIDSLGWARYKAGVIHDVKGPDGTTTAQGAASLLTRALELARQTGNDDAVIEVPIVADHAGDALWLAGDREQALDHWRTTVTLGREALDNPDFAEALTQPIFQELSAAVQSAQQKIDDATADRKPATAPTLRPVEPPAPEPQPEATSAQPTDAHQPPRDTMTQPSAGADPG